MTDSDFYIGMKVDSKGGNFKGGIIEELYKDGNMEIAVVYWPEQNLRQKRSTSILYPAE